ncbi:hypothetical protein CEXT_238631 [Caerostris extrusa]|uniref:Uncharacterized protein n=1 Tax=Caerostris extrusa TaxID=172846 RepID=A0AAV4PAG9_CAEEX|nr:hypothetical protein CEXT_238631 [Caerostris extrusa]
MGVPYNISVVVACSSLFPYSPESQEDSRKNCTPLACTVRSDCCLAVYVITLLGHFRRVVIQATQLPWPPVFFGTMWRDLPNSFLDGRQTPEATRNSNSCFVAFNLSAGNRRGLAKTGGHVFEYNTRLHEQFCLE